MLFTSNHYTVCSCFAWLAESFYPSHSARPERFCWCGNSQSLYQLQSGVAWEARSERLSIPRPCPSSLDLSKSGSKREEQEIGSSRSKPGGRTPARVPLLTLTLRLGPSWLCRPQALHFAVRCGMWQMARLQDWDLVGNGRDRPATASSALKANASSGSLGRGGHGWDSS